MSRLLARMAGWLPRCCVRPLAMRYVAGETAEQALAAVRRLNESRFAATLNVLGEFAGAEDAPRTADEYIDLLKRIAVDDLDCDISVKLTHLGLNGGEADARANLQRILLAAQQAGRFVRIDMEGSAFTDRTLAIVRDFRHRGHDIGAVLQATLKRSVADAAGCGDLNIRVCKGAYPESAEIAWQDDDRVRESFLAITRALLDAGAHVAAATHDRVLIARLREMLPPERGEFQVLLGVPMGGLLEELKQTHTVRVYVPFGPAWYSYCIRRVRENPRMVRYVLGNLFRKGN